MIDWTKWKLVPVEATPEMCRQEQAPGRHPRTCRAHLRNAAAFVTAEAEAS